MKPLHIVIASHYLPPHRGGIEMVAYQQALGLTNQGHTVTSISSNVCGSLVAKSSHRNHTVVTVKAWNGLEKTGIPFPVFSPSLMSKTFRAVRTADVVHIHDAFYQTSLVAAVAARIYKKPLFLTQHVGLIHHSSKLVMTMQKIVYKTTGRFIFNSAIKIFTYNDNVSAFLGSLGVPPTKIISAMNGVDTVLFRPVDNAQEKNQLRKKYGLPPAGALVLFVGRLVPKKGYQTLLNAWPKDKCSLVFAGSSTVPSDFVSQPNIYNLGSQEQPKLAEIYRACDVFVLPSVGEGFPLSVQEAMASGLQVITTNDSGYDKYIFDTSVVQLVSPEVNVIHKAIQANLAAPAVQKAKMAQYGRSYAIENFSWDKLLKLNLDQYYAKLSGAKS